MITNILKLSKLKISNQNYINYLNNFVPSKICKPNYKIINELVNNKI